MKSSSTFATMQTAETKMVKGSLLLHHSTTISSAKK